MPLWILRLCMAILLIWAIIMHKSIIPPYLIALMALLEFLNYRKEFNNNPNHKTINLMSFSFIFIIFLNRIRSVHYTPEFEIPVNILEHLLFSFFMCVALWEIMKMKFVPVLKLRYRLLFINLVFFLIGVGNEIYQYLAYFHSSGAMHFFLLDSIKDIFVNSAGALLFSIIVAAVNRPTFPFVKQFIIDNPKK